ncbi:MAG: hypothetical protein SWY16_14135 [Cyanobacteriota bacterium]|nr:hypothetical protein [Cyanobacteriota bacterium]
MLIDTVKQICDRLSSGGWDELMLRHGLDLTAPDLAAELTRELPNIDRTLPGFEDFAFEGKQAIEPGFPARSLLFHALASPNVTQGATGEELSVFPTLAEIEAVENYTFGVRPPSLSDIINRAEGDFLAIVVFASEYRPAAETVHRQHADLCFSRTGVARVGTAAPRYDSRRRGFLPFVEGDENAFRVLPARYSAYIAVQRRGDENAFGPMNFSFRQKHPELYGRGQVSDGERQFWVPLHKLFDGAECIRDLDLTLTLEAHHVNEKLRRLHLELGSQGHDTDWGEPDISNAPFIFTEGIAEWSGEVEYGAGLLVPAIHPNLIEAARYRDRPLTFRVPPNPRNPWAPSLLVEPEGGVRRAPEYVHVRHQVLPDGTRRDLNEVADVADEVRRGNYRAQHYIDFTGDGWIEASCPQLAAALPRTVPAYSMVTAPDFYPNCDQRELMEWWLQRVPEALRSDLWQTPPLTLADERLAPNLQLRGADFRPEDDTVTAIVSLLREGEVRAMPTSLGETQRHSYLADSAAGVFAPGWDTSRDRTGDTEHLAAYGLGSPFPEDAKLCAALSTFWPAVAPDAGRSFSQIFPTVSPLTDTEIRDMPWDGVDGPRVVLRENQPMLEYARFDYVDYVENTLDGKFSLALTGKVDVREYIARVLAMARAYRGAGIEGFAKQSWAVLSFRGVGSTEAQRQEAETQTGVQLQGDVYRVEFVRRGSERPHPEDLRKVHYEIGDRTVVFVGSLPQVLVTKNEGGWDVVRTV